MRQLLQGSLDDATARPRKVASSALASASIVAAASLLLMLGHRVRASCPRPKPSAVSRGRSWRSFWSAPACSWRAFSSWPHGSTATARCPFEATGSSETPRLGIRNASRHRSRSLMTTSLIAAATFVVVAVAAGRKNPAVEAPQMNSGNGGYSHSSPMRARRFCTTSIPTQVARKLRLGIGARRSRTGIAGRHARRSVPRDAR